MQIIVELPDDIARHRDPAREALEALALEGYRSEQLTESDIRQLLGFETRIEVHAFLKEYDMYLPYTPDDLQHDREVARNVAKQMHIPDKPVSSE